MANKINSVLITGGTGSFGKTMMRSLLERDTPEIRILSRDEEKQDAIRSQLNDPRVRFFIGDIRDRSSVDRAVNGVDAIFHAAALKQVPSCEFFPFEAVRTNIMGSENVIRSAIHHKVKTLVCLSTDKAVMPINAMGMSKAMMEKHAQAAAREIGADGDTKIACVRYGNVMYSRGSVIPLFIKQIKEGTPITITEPEMTRFLMPLRDSVALVHYAFEHVRQGDLFVKKASAATIADLVEALKQLFNAPDHKVIVIGWRHGEKLYETLASAQELTTSEDLGDYWRLQLDGRDLNYSSFFDEGESKTAQLDDYHSHNTHRLDVAGVKELLLSLPEVQAELQGWQGQ
ncbi:UDP-glucose 4-epimerase [Sphingorhabdus lutea]|uniref:UDP-glucose 4-epimerase n=1 Tax=Sphingorhabdus lutea TaxID=1913578 RepID=A0A1L3JBK1_9SPHN|nr:SDR family NAD(P)-dependent oxidoreductase [Sphingorhabdus lutea]APG62498.1 UDP-glucose 4-epimerase [Sphingorhabdus lutea]